MTEESPGYENKKTPEESVPYWFNEIDEAMKRDKQFRKDGERILDIYKGADNKKVPFNILYSNIDTLLPALYSSQPRPVVQRRFKDPDPIANAASQAGTRILEFFLDSNMDGSQTVHDAMIDVTYDALLVGRGVTRLKYEAEFNEQESEEEAEPITSKESEYVCAQSIEWNRVLFGYAKKWTDVPWVAFEEIIDKSEAIRLFGEEMANKLAFVSDNDKPDNDKIMEEDEHQGGRKTAAIYQIWDKLGGKKIRYISKSYKDGFLKVDDDPLELTGFYPMPKPLQLVETNDFSPVAPYLIYENQAKELNEITRRINKLVRQIKAGGIYDGEMGDDIANLLSSDDTTFIPADKSALLSTQKGFDNAIWFLPIDQMIKVLQGLYQSREACKQVIYEVTGISDIIRGSTVASETATAQNIKSQWGTMRLKRNQSEVQRYARDILRIALEIAATKYSAETWVQMTELPFSTDDQVQQANMIMHASQRMIMPGQAPNPQVQQAQQQAQQILQQPQWSQILELLKNDMQRAFRIDIETNSTVIPEAVEDQKNIADVMTALGQYLQGVTPLVQQGIFPFAAAKSMMMAIVRRYQFGAEIEDYINDMKEPQPVDNSAQELQAKQQSEQMMMQAKQQSEQAAMQADIQKAQAANQLEAQKLEAQRIIEQGKAETQMRIEQMRIESAERIAEFKARADAENKLELARIQNACSMKQMAMKINSAKGDDGIFELDDEGEPLPKQPMKEELLNVLDAIPQLQSMIEQMAELIGEQRQNTETIAATINAPKTVIRDNEGKITAISSDYGHRVVQRDENGNIVSIQ